MLRQCGRLAAALALAVPTISTMPATAHAAALYGIRQVTLPFYDSANPLRPPCLVYVTLGGNPTPVAGSADVEEYGLVRIDPSGWCATILWSARVTVVDTAPGHAVRAAAAEAGPSSAPVAEVRPRVAYGLTVREAGVITYQFELASAIGQACFVEAWTMDAVTRAPAPVPGLLARCTS